MNRRALCLVTWLAALLAAAPHVGAHDMWIAPTPVEGGNAGDMDLQLVIGHEATRTFYPRNNGRILRFARIGQKGGPQAITGPDNQLPAGRLNGVKPGGYTIVYTSKPAQVTLSPRSFRAYVQQEGDDRALPLLQRLDIKGDQGESYARHLKSLIRVGESKLSHPKGHDGGLSLEFLVLSDPFDARVPMRLRLMHRGLPSVGARVRAFRADGKGKTVIARTDTQGEVVLSLPAQKGHLWVVASVHMVLHADGRWHSDWTTLSVRR